MGLLNQLCFLRRHLPQELAYKIVIFTRIAPRELRQDIILLRPLSGKSDSKLSQTLRDDRFLHDFYSTEKNRGIFKISRCDIQELLDDLDIVWGATESPTKTTRFNRTKHEFDWNDVHRCQPGGCGFEDCECCNPSCLWDRDISWENERKYIEQSNWSDIDILNHLRTSECRLFVKSDSTSGTCRTKSIISDIIVEMDRAFQNDLGETVNIQWVPKQSEPGYINIIYNEG